MTGSLEVELEGGEIYLVAYQGDKTLAKFHLQPGLADDLLLRLRRAIRMAEGFHKTEQLN
jgi:hypothetical protein